MQSTPNILKALKICNPSSCHECPYNDDSCCLSSLRKDAHALISGLLAEKSIQNPETPAEPWTREKILAEAQKCVCGQREQDYGTPENNFGRIAEFWSTYKGVEFSTVDVAIMMALLKVARIANNPGYLDNYVDGCGYFCIGGELSETERN